MTAESTTGPILWIRPAWQKDTINPNGIMEFINPGRLVFVSALQRTDLFWTAEEALRSGLVPTTILDLWNAPLLTPVRRLHIAAEAGVRQTGIRPVCILLVPGSGGAVGIESRWSMVSRHGRNHDCWYLERLRSRHEPPKGWYVMRDEENWILSSEGVAGNEELTYRAERS